MARIIDNEKTSDYLWAGAFSGLAAASKLCVEVLPRRTERLPFFSCLLYQPGPMCPADTAEQSFVKSVAIAGYAR